MRKRRPPRRVPRFPSEAAERAYWETHDTADYVDWRDARLAVFPNLKPSTETISLRLPAGLLAELKTIANQRDVPYQSLLKIFLAERMVSERGREPRAPRAEGARRTNARSRAGTRARARPRLHR
jgi:predicted DNA binding CopG/RHH family protein